MPLYFHETDGVEILDGRYGTGAIWMVDSLAGYRGEVIDLKQVIEPKYIYCIEQWRGDLGRKYVCLFDSRQQNMDGFPTWQEARDACRAHLDTIEGPRLSLNPLDRSKVDGWAEEPKDDTDV